MDKIVKEVDLLVAKPFIEEWHYSHKTPTGKNIFFAWFIDGDIYAIADYGIGVNPYQATFLAEQTGEKVVNENLLELKRLCRSEPKLDLNLTQFLSQCHKILKKRGYRYIVSFSDPEHGHNGGIYKAANFQHLGTTNAEWHLIDKEGNVRHRRYAHRYAERNNCTIKEARERLNVIRRKSVPKDRWFLKL